MVNFADKFGLPKDRVKLEAGLTDFDIVKIEITQSKKKYDVREELPDGSTKITRKLIDIAYFDTAAGEKYYSPNAPIVSACKDILKAYGKVDGTLKEVVHINEVKEGIGEGKNPYIFFA